MNKLTKLSVLGLACMALLLGSNFVIERTFSKKQVHAIKHIAKNDSLVRLRDGDIIFQSSFSGQSKAIQLATHSKFSHCGILFFENNQWFVYEAVQPVKKTAFEKWITHGDNNAYKIMRLKEADQLLNAAGTKALKAECIKHLGKDYDLTFEWSDNRIYCSELVWKAYKNALKLQVGELQALKDFDLTHPAVKEKLKERYGSNIPYNETVISPGKIAESNLLFTVSDTF